MKKEILTFSVALLSAVLSAAAPTDVYLLIGQSNMAGPGAVHRPHVPRDVRAGAFGVRRAVRPLRVERASAFGDWSLPVNKPVWTGG